MKNEKKREINQDTVMNAKAKAKQTPKTEKKSRIISKAYTFAGRDNELNEKQQQILGDKRVYCIFALLIFVYTKSSMCSPFLALCRTVLCRRMSMSSAVVVA